MLQDFFEHTINKAYQNVRAILIWFGEPLPTASSYIRFGGWEMSYNWKGWVRPTKEVVGDIRIITKTVHLNYRYALQLMKVDTGEEYDFTNLVHTLAHELAHCLLIDYDPKYFAADNDPHSEKHRLLTNQFELYLWTLPEIQELSYFQNSKLI